MRPQQRRDLPEGGAGVEVDDLVVADAENIAGGVQEIGISPIVIPFLVAAAVCTITVRTSSA
ncbi:hypothetical protein [Pseudonocardia sp. NPDC046786]|uniref:hypothetical protein n=1 Tax=Pseudonocardia sp. NPDC046786 TaxID=3155471 RepID=UPI0034036642